MKKLQFLKVFGAGLVCIPLAASNVTAQPPEGRPPRGDAEQRDRPSPESRGEGRGEGFREGFRGGDRERPEGGRGFGGPGGGGFGFGGPGGGGFGGPGMGGPDAGRGMAAMAVMMALDADGDGELSEKEIYNAVTVLMAMDANKDRKLTSEELRPDPRAMAERMGERMGRDIGSGGPGGPAGPAMVERLMAMDKNGDGILSKDEIPERAAPLVSRADKNGDGDLSKEELEAFAKQINDFGGQRPGRPDADADSPRGPENRDNPRRGQRSEGSGRPESETPEESKEGSGRPSADTE